MNEMIDVSKLKTYSGYAKLCIVCKGRGSYKIGNPAVKTTCYMCKGSGKG